MSLLMNHSYRFGEFTLDADQRVLLHANKPVPVTPKAFETLLILVENSGQIVERAELMNRIWPDTFVEEANLTFNINQLRRLLGDHARRPAYIETVARRGYRFIANVEEVLGERGAISDEVCGPIETHDGKIGDFTSKYAGEAGAQETEDVIESAQEKSSASAESIFAGTTVARAASARVSRRSIMFAIAVVVFLTGAGLILWRFLDRRTEGRFAVAVPLKLERLTGTGQSRQVAISADGKYIAYTRSVERKVSIWLRQLATNTNVEIVPATDLPRIYGLLFANSGEYLYFVRGDPTALYRVSLLGGVPTKIVDKLEGNFSISPDDSQIGFVRQVISRKGQPQYSLLIVNSNGTGERTLLTGTIPETLDVPLWSPDGGSIICSYGNSQSGGQDVRLVEVSVVDGTTRELTSERFFYISKIAWLPDRSGMIISARKELGGDNQLWRVSYPAMQIHQITEGIIYYVDLSIASSIDKAVASKATRISDIWVGSSHEPRNLKKITQAIDKFCWTPSGRLVYSSMASGNLDLWIMQPDGTEQRQLTVHTAVNDRPAVTRDNRYIAFLSTRTGTYQVWRMNLDGSNQVQLTTGAGKGHPAISADGKWVLFNTTDDGHLWRVPIDGGEAQPLTDYPALFPAVSPDGKMIACMERNEPKRELSILVLPFAGGPPLRRMEFTGGGFSGYRIEWAEGGKALIYAAERNGPTVILKQSLEGGQPQEIMGFEEDELFDFGSSPDGQLFAVTRGVWQHDVVLISDLLRTGNLPPLDKSH